MPKLNADSVKITIGGKTFDFMMTPYGIMIAEEHGIDILQLFDQIGSQLKDDASPTKQLSLISKIIWAGILPFNEDMTLKDVQMLMTFNDFGTVAPIIGDSMKRLIKGAEPDEVDMAKKKPKKSTSTS